MSCGLFALPALTVLLALSIDPLGAHPAIHLETLEPYRQNGSRGAKVARLERGGWQTLVFGDSRSHAAIDPGSAVFGGHRVYNAAVPSTTVRETEILVDVGLRHSKPERILLFVQLDFFDQGFEGPHQLFDDHDRPESRLKRWLGWPTLSGVGTTLQLRWRKQPSATHPLGMRRPSRPADTRRSFENVLAKRRDLGRRFVFSPERWAAMERIVAATRASGATTYVAIAPVHATLLEAFEELGLGPDYEIMIRRLATLARPDSGDAAAGPVAVWDFSGYAGPQAEPLPPAGETGAMQGYFEASHYRPELAEAAISEMFGNRSAEDSLGFPLSPATVEADLERLARERDLYRHQRADDVAFVRNVLGGSRTLDESADGSLAP